MRCTRCDYRLWNLSARTCPECGEPFRPSEYRFRPNSVKFCCPHCDQSYFGTSRDGLLMPAEFDCVQCGQHIHLDQMVLRPGDGVTEAQTEVTHNPWLRRKHIGIVKTFFKMIGRGMVDPINLMRATPVDSGNGQAWWYLIFMQLVAAGMLSLFCAVVGGFFALLVTQAGGPGGGGGAPLLPMIGFGSLWAFGLSISTIVLTLIWGAVAHLFLWMGAKPSHSIGRTYQALCYTSGPYILAAIPICGMYGLAMVGAVWWIVSATLGLRQAQQVTGGQATLATLAFPAIGIVLGFGGFLAMIAFSTNKAMTAPGPAGTFATTNLGGNAAQALVDYATDHQGRGPKHGLQLMQTDHLLFTTDYQLFTSESDPSLTVIGDYTLSTLESDPAALAATAQAQARKMPNNAVAHRVGDLVFTHHGVRLVDGDRNLWTVIVWPDPDFNDPPAGFEMIEIGLADGKSIQTSAQLFDQQLKAQNQIRRDYNLPPLPHPSKVTHDEPATSR